MSPKRESKKASAQPPIPSSRSRLILREGAWIALLVVCAVLLVALISYSPADPGWSHTGNHGRVSNSIGPTGAWVADVFYSLFGYMAYLFPLLLAIRAWRVLRLHREESEEFDWLVLSLRLLGLSLVMISATALATLHYTEVGELPFGVGGILGNAITGAASTAFSLLGSTMLLLAIFLFGLTIFADISWLSFIDGTGRLTLATIDDLRHRIALFRLNSAEKRKSQAALKQRQQLVEEKSLRSKKRIAPTIQPPPKQAPSSVRVEKEKQTSLFEEEPLIGELPPLDLLDKVVSGEKRGYSPDSLEAMSRQLELKLQDFGISAEVVEVQPGPVVTRFELQPAAGVKVNRITNLAKDLARSLAVISVRVVEVIPGKSVVGIEIPNEYREVVRLGDVLSSEIYDSAKSPLTLALGHDISGNPVVADLSRMPHLLVAGTTGSGKSVGINAMLLSLLYKSTPERVRLILVDPKMLELSVYEGIPHLLTPVITDMRDAATGLRWCVGEMERRYRLMAALGVRNLAGYNRKIEEAVSRGKPLLDPLWQPDANRSVFHEEVPEQTAPELKKLPFIVVVIDEFADMMMIVGKKVEQLIARIAQKARAAGIHLILATQRPSVDVITGLIKANIPCRIAFQVSSKIDSRTILDQGGADQLLGHGDMLYLPPGTSVPIRVHGAFVDDHEVHRVVKDWKRRGEPEYLEAVLDEAVTGAIPVPGFATENGEEDAEADELYDEAVAFVLESRKASISAVQRKLRIGYNRAARLIEAMESAGVVSEMSSNGVREVLVPGRPGD